MVFAALVALSPVAFGARAKRISDRQNSVRSTLAARFRSGVVSQAGRIGVLRIDKSTPADIRQFAGTTGAELKVPYYLGLLATAHTLAGRVPEALALLDEALAWVERTDERWYEAELHRLKGELLLRKCREAGAKPAPRESQPGHTALPREAEACFQSALAIARRQGAKLLELRAALSLSRLWQQQGKRAAARQLLAEVYGWFTEGFETADLQEARVLLEELA